MSTPASIVTREGRKKKGQYPRRNSNHSSGSDSNTSQLSQGRQMFESDESYARALQRQYREEFMRRQRVRNSDPTDAAMEAVELDLQEIGAAPRHTHGESSGEPIVCIEESQSERSEDVDIVAASGGGPVKVTLDSTAEDELLARRLQKQWDQQRNRSSVPPMSDQELQNISNNNRLSTMTGITHPLTDSFHGSSDFYRSALESQKVRRAHSAASRTASNSDSSASSEHARKIAQELDDAELAHRLALYEEETRNLRRAQRYQQQEYAAARTQSSKARVCVQVVLPLLCVALIVVVLFAFLFGGLDPDNVPVVGDFFGDDWVDPFFGGDVDFGEDDLTIPDATASDAISWANSGRGISLEILNAMDDSWQEHLAVAVNNWENGDPIDSLTLTTTRVSYDYDCTAVEGKLKVCNGDYGDTRWRGLNELLVDQRSYTIVYSSAKMNEYYLSGSNQEDQQLYTLCHEMGHGFGLPHWDENFFNEDSGNCMDYTNNPGANKWPDASNFLYLAELYGGINITTGLYVSEVPANVVIGNAGSSEGNDDETRGRQLQQPMSPGSYASRVRGLQNTESRRRREVLHANQHVEVHRVLHEDGDPHLVHFEFYLMHYQD